MKPVSVRSTQPETYPLTPRLPSDPAPSRSLQRLLLLLGILLSIVFLLVAAAFLVGCVLVSRAIQEIDLSAIRVILEAARTRSIRVCRCSLVKVAAWRCALGRSNAIASALRPAESCTLQQLYHMASCCCPPDCCLLSLSQLSGRV